MANIFQDKIVKYLTLGLVLGIIGMLAQSFLLAKPGPLPDSQTAVIENLLEGTLKAPPVAFDPKSLETLKIENLKPFEVVNLPTQVGRINPFEPYPLKEEITTTTLATTTITNIPVTTSATSTATTTP